MDYLLICTCALLASLLTLFSGFGLGTLLMPVVALFFPLDLAIAITAVVHLANNLFKAGLLGRRVNWPVFWRFGLPAIACAFAGAWLLSWLAGQSWQINYDLLGWQAQTSLIGLVIGLLILTFVLLELSPAFNRLAFPRALLPIGGAISGFFGGLSGHQGALRSLFLVKSGLDKHAFVATGAWLAMVVDLVRLAVYGAAFSGQSASIDWPLVLAASLCAFLGAWLGAKLLHKVTLGWVQKVVSIMLTLVAIAMIAGLV